MFTGIVEDLGEIKSLSSKGNVRVLEISSRKVLMDTKIGDSISVNGCCLTVTESRVDSLLFEAMPQTLMLTNLGKLRIGEKINLERSLKVGERVSGHFVSGHVDCLGVIRRKRHLSGNLSFEIAVPTEFIKFCLPKGSIAIDGISLTIVDTKSNIISVYIIPHTLKNTTLSFKGPSDLVNIEFDLLAKRP
jgi:riboflavin synthase